MKRSYSECISKNLIKPIEKTEERSVEMINLVKHKLEFWNKVIKIAENYPTVLIESHYELIKELLIAIMNIDGFKSETHDCIFYYIEEKHEDLDLDFCFLHELRVARNNVDYKGVKLPQNSWNELRLKINLTIMYLINYLEEKIPGVKHQ